MKGFGANTGLQRASRCLQATWADGLLVHSLPVGLKELNDFDFGLDREIKKFSVMLAVMLEDVVLVRVPGIC